MWNLKENPDNRRGFGLKKILKKPTQSGVLCEYCTETHILPEMPQYQKKQRGKKEKCDMTENVKAENTNICTFLLCS